MLMKRFLKEVKKVENGDLIIKYKEEQSIDREMDKKIEAFFKTLGYKWTGSGISIPGEIRDIRFTKL
ncbi:hypothetical protein LCGC14_2427470 [marine sediment metagenome]|uniref:Uncharacterized protein n=1 Tax=marine sediment metagenome TaxID=412755 RepID=A0A0F9E001_9ZZZZ